MKLGDVARKRMVAGLSLILLLFFFAGRLPAQEKAAETMSPDPLLLARMMMSGDYFLNDDWNKKYKGFTYLRFRRMYWAKKSLYRYRQTLTEEEPAAGNSRLRVSTTPNDPYYSDRKSVV